MASTYDNSLRLELIATGEAASTWGDKTNANLTAIAAAFGYATQDGFAADANATTTVADGAADPARALYFKITSSATLTATRTLTIAPNTISRVMWIENATTGSQSIEISQGSGANVTIPAGKTAVVYLDGAGAGASVVDAMASLNVDGTISAGAATFSGDVGIGGSPLKPLHVFGPDGAGEGTPTFNANTVAVFQNNGTSADGTILNIVSGSASTGFIAFGNSTDDIRQAIVANMSDDSLELRTGNNSTALAIDASGNVGIGDTTFAAGKLQVYDSSGNHVWLKGRASDGTSSVSFRNNADNTYNGRIQVADTGGMSFQVAGSTRATISASGNLLVGKTTTAFGTEGFVYEAGAAVEVTTDSNRVMRLNRTTSNGNIIELNKDGTTVGSIANHNATEFGLVSEKNLVLTQKTTTEKNLVFSSTYFGSFGVDDATLDLGRSVGRFKDLYLSGGVYLGGTGAANLLDDYEEGTWTPAFAGTTGTYAGTYTKVGRLVYIRGYLSVTGGTPSAGGGSLEITGLPFNPLDGTTGDIMTSNLDIGSTTYQVTSYALPGSKVRLYASIDNTGWTAMAANSAAVGTSLIFTISYEIA
jgi:redox-sensitive bicupin YhaK (pirin superfamily)